MRSTELAVAILALGLSACGGGGGGGGDEEDEDLVVVEFALTDRDGNPTGARGSTDVCRNVRIRLTLSAAVDPASVDDRSIRIGVPTAGSLLLDIPGRFTVDGNVVVFDPTFTPAGEPRPLGLPANTDHVVRVPAPPSTRTLRNRSGDPIRDGFETTFSTSDRYLPDLDQPRILSVEPRPGATGADSKADVVVTFSEPMHPDSFDRESTFRVRILDRGADAFGFFLFSADAQAATFRPTIGYGSGPYTIRVELTSGLTDLAGHGIANPTVFTFVTEHDPGAPNPGLVVETFEDRTREDTSFRGPNGEALAAWNGVLDPGALSAVYHTRNVQLPPPQQAWGWLYPPVDAGSWSDSKAMCLLLGSTIQQAPATVTKVYWSPALPAPGTGNVWSGLRIRIGHTTRTSLSAVFDENFDDDPVTLVSNASYTVPLVQVITYVPFPTTGTFEYNGRDGLVVEVSKTASTGALYSCGWRTLRTFVGQNVNGRPASASVGSVTDHHTYHQFEFRTETSLAQSLWYRTDSSDPAYLEPIVTPRDPPPGTLVVLQFAGAEDDGHGAVDPATVSDFTTDPRELEGYEYVRFRVRFTANAALGIGPRIEEIVLPYTFR